jgi:ADP-heptose:LPS heptosyltransferase
VTDKTATHKLSPDNALGLAASFMHGWRRGEDPDLEIIDQLGCLGLSSDPKDAVLGTKALYSIIIEGLCDDFSSSGVNLGNIVLLRLLALARNHPTGLRTNNLLNSLGFTDSQKLLERYQRLWQRRLPANKEFKKVKKIIVLSRVTVGSDLAITSIIVQRLRHSFANAETVIIGPRHINEIFYDLDRVSYLAFNYVRQGTLVERLTFWPELYDLVEQQCRGLASGEIILFDPDSRLSQLGLLPLLPEQDTYYFNSRQDQSPASSDFSLRQLTNKWLDKILNDSRVVQPMVANCAAHEEAATVFFRQIKHSFVVAANFGVGGDSRKRVTDPFEELLIFALLATPNTILLLDTGNTGEEKTRIAKILRSAADKGISTDTVNENELDCKKINFSHGIINFNGGVSSLAAVIRRSNIFLGYDSCCQHLATALGIPAVIAFAGAPNQRFRRRWQPGNQKGLTITVAIENQPQTDEIPELVKKIIVAVDKISERPS